MYYYASNGFTFDIPEQDSDGMTVVGHNGVTLGDVKYHGAYLSATKNLTFFLLEKGYEKDGYIEFSAIKQ